MSSDLRTKLNRQEVCEGVAELLKPAIARAVHEATMTCITCDHFDLSKEVCMKFNYMRPPARVIAFGCPAYENEIPF